MKTRLLSLMIVLALIIIITPAAHGDTSTSVPGCFNLSAEDCAFLWTAITKSNLGIHSFQQTIRLDVAMDGWMGPAGDGKPELSVSVEGQGVFKNDPARSLQDPLGATDLAVNLKARSSNGSQAVESPLNIAFVDATGYWQDPYTGQWVGISSQDAMAMAMAMMGVLSQMSPMDMVGAAEQSAAAAGMPMMIDPALINSWMNAGQVAVGMGMSLAAMPVTAVLPTPSFVVSYERLDPVELQGQTMSPFVLTLDLQPLLSSEKFQSTVAETLNAAAETSGDPTLSMVAQMLPMVLNATEASMQITQWIGHEDQFVHELTVDVTLAFDSGALMGMPSSGAPATVTVHLDVTMDQINADIQVEAPRQAALITADSLGLMLTP